MVEVDKEPSFQALGLPLIHYLLACVASVSVEFSALKSRFSYFWTRAKWGENEKREGGGEERGRKETLARKPHDFAERPLDTFTLERTLVECLSNTP